MILTKHECLCCCHLVFLVVQLSTQKKSNPVSIQVLPIPHKNRPKNFTGAVGQFRVTGELGGEKVKVNQPVSLKLRFEGRGNPKLIDLPEVHFPSEFEVYDTKKEQKFFDRRKELQRV